MLCHLQVSYLMDENMPRDVVADKTAKLSFMVVLVLTKHQLAPRP